MLRNLFKEKDKNYNEIIYNCRYNEFNLKTFRLFLKEVLKTDLYNKVIKFKNIADRYCRIGISTIMTILLLEYSKNSPKNILVVTNTEKEVKKLISSIKDIIKNAKRYDDLYIIIFGDKLFKFNTGHLLRFANLKSKYDVSHLMEGMKYDYIVYAGMDFNDIEVDLNYNKIKTAFDINKRTDTLQILTYK